MPGSADRCEAIGFIRSYWSSWITFFIAAAILHTQPCSVQLGRNARTLYVRADPKSSARAHLINNNPGRPDGNPVWAHPMVLVPEHEGSANDFLIRPSLQSVQLA